MKLLFLDIDGVLNRHERHANGYCGIHPECAAELNRILEACPGVRVVITSAWRYCVHNELSSIKGLEHTLLTHGIACEDRVHGVTLPDPEVFIAADHKPPFDKEYWDKRGREWRKQQIENFVRDEGMWFAIPKHFVVLDDLDLGMPELVRTDPSIGLTAELADEVIARFRRMEG